MKKIRKSVLTAMLCVGLVLGLCACGKGKDDSKTYAEGDTIEIVLWYTSGSRSQAHVERLIDKFNESQDKYWVRVQNNGDPSAIRTKLETTQSKDNYPDLFLGQAAATCYFANAEYVTPVQEFIDKEDSDWTTGIYENVRKTYTDLEGNMIGYPLGVSTSGYWVNVDALKSAGYTIDDITSFEKVAEITRAIVNKGICKYGLSTLGTGVELMDMLTIQGVDYVDNENGYKGAPTKSLLMTGATHDAYKKAAQIYAGLRKDNIAMEAGTDVSAECFPLFNSGDLAMLYATNSWTHYVLDAEVEFEYAFIPSVGVDENAKYKGHALSEGTGLYIANTGNEQKMQGAYEFIKFWAEPENQSTYAQALGYVPYTDEAFAQEDYQAWMAENLPSAQLIVDRIKSGPVELRTPYVEVFDDMLSVTNTLFTYVSSDPEGNLDEHLKYAAEAFEEGLEIWKERQ